MRLLHRLENLLLAATLAALLVFGVASVYPAWAVADELIRHLTLLAGMVGGMVAARDGQLLAMGAVVQALPRRLRAGAALVTGLVATAIAALLALAAWQFVREEAATGSTLAFGIPRIALQAALPAGFAVITLRLAWRSAEGTGLRLLVLVAAVTGAVVAERLGADLAMLRVPLLLLLALATALGAPIFTVLAGVALIWFLTAGDPIASVPLDHYDQVTNPLLATLPLFTLAGYVVAATGAARRLVRLLRAWTGHLRGGPAVVTVLACAFFTAFTGGSGVTILALGGLLMPILLSSGYREQTALGLVTGAGSLGVLFAPCLPLILYSIVAQVPMTTMFLGAALPGLLLVLLAAAWGVLASPPVEQRRRRFSLRRALVATWRAKWELLLPVLPLTLIFGGFALPVPAAALTAAFALFAAAALNRDLPRAAGLLEVVRECGALVGGILLILGAAMGLTNLLITAHVPDRLTEWIGATLDSRWLFLLALNLFLLAVGCLMDIFSAIIVIAPLVVPVGLAFGMDPVHLGVILLANLELGYLTPPVGLNLFMSAARFGRPVLKVARASLPMLAVLAAGLVAITALPELTLALPRWFAAAGLE
ncbi:MAG: TRAP transporter large permease subunit [Gammaproteobacteria bacterium]|nr:TRAP transporter large permease subunit [Gammaproteobacteria bacterium]